MSESFAYYCAFWFAYGNERNVKRADRFAQWYVATKDSGPVGIESAWTEYVG